MRRGIGGRPTFLPLPGQNGPRYWGRSRMGEERVETTPRSLDSSQRASALTPSLGMKPDLVVWPFLASAALAVCLLPTLSCSSKPDPDTLVMIIENSPTDLDPRVGLDAQ